jgi:hypothetical protein
MLAIYDIEGLNDLNPQFSIDSDENFDITLNNQSQYFAEVFKLDYMAKKYSEHPPETAAVLMKQFSF